MKSFLYKQEFAVFRLFALGFLVHALLTVAVHIHLAMSLAERNPTDDPTGWDMLIFLPLLIIDYPLIVSIDKIGLSIWSHCLVITLVGGFIWGLIFVLFATFVKRLRAK